jgi:hypothetical protein
MPILFISDIQNSSNSPNSQASTASTLSPKVVPSNEIDDQWEIATEEDALNGDFEVAA